MIRKIKLSIARPNLKLKFIKIKTLSLGTKKNSRIATFNTRLRRKNLKLPKPTTKAK